MRPTIAAMPSRSVKMRTAWPTPTAPSRTIAGNPGTKTEFGVEYHGTQPPYRAIPQYRHHGAYRRRQDNHDRADPLLHRQVLPDRRSARRRGQEDQKGRGERRE